MKLLVIRSVWGCEHYNRDWPALLARLKKEGFDGVEASLGDVGPTAADLTAFQAALEEHGFCCIVGVYTSWQDYEGPWEDKPIEEHVAMYREQLKRAQLLNPLHINVHSGQDSWSYEEAERYFALALEVEAELGIANASHETHRGRALFNPWVTERLCSRFQTLKLTADFSHWTVVSERLLDTPRGKRAMDMAISRVVHVHSRVGHAQGAQVSDPEAPEWAVEVAAHEGWWDQVWQRHAAEGRAYTTVTPEYGPTPYTPALPRTCAPVSDVWKIIVAARDRHVHRFRTLFAAPGGFSGHQFETIPIVDISALMSGGSEDGVEQTAAAIHAACESVGFFYVVGHGVELATLRKAHRLAREFFALPHDDKMVVAIGGEEQSPPCRGYQRVGENVTKGQADWHEALDFMKEFEASHPDVVAGKPLHCPNKWPSEPTDFAPFFQQYVEAVAEVGRAILRGMARGLGLPEDAFSSACDDSFWIMRVIGYPEAQSPGSIGCGEHTDYGCLTLVNQDETKGALQVKNFRGEWVHADPVEGALIVNIGDMFEVWTGGRYRATPHRVVSANAQYRTSIPFFLEPNFDAVISPLLPCDSSSPVHSSIVYGEHLLAKVARNFNTDLP